MSIKAAKRTRITLLVFAILTFLGSLSVTKAVKLKHATDTSRIAVRVTDMKGYYNPEESPYINGCYHIAFTFELKNNTGVCWNYLSVETEVYDTKGKYLGKITSSFSMSLDVREKVTAECEIKNNRPSDFDMMLYNGKLSDFVFKPKVISGNYKR